MSFAPLAYPPDSPSYYRFVYRDGYLIAVYRHDSEGVHLNSQIFYSKTKVPLLSVNYARDGRILWYGHLTYDGSGLIKRVVRLNHALEPLFVTCFVNSGLYTNSEQWHYTIKADGTLSFHYINDGPSLYRIVDGKRNEINRGSRIWWITRMSTKGIRPLYPLPLDNLSPSRLRKDGKVQHL